MDILGIGPLELLLILVIALIVVGPRDLAKTARAAGRFLNRLYRSDLWRTLTDASRNLRTLPNRLAREAALEELDEVRQAVEETTREVGAGLKPSKEALRAWTPGSVQEELSTRDPPAPAEPESEPESSDG